MRRTTLLLCALCLQLLLGLASAQQTGEYPGVASVATYRPVTADSVCGANGPEQYCQYTTDSIASLLPNCIEAICDNTCQFSILSPTPFLPAEVGVRGAGVTPSQGRDGSGNTALRFQGSSIEVAAGLVPLLTDNGFTFAAWINSDEGASRGTLISKSSSDADSILRNYAVSVDANTLVFDYFPNTLDTSSLPVGSQQYRSVVVSGLSLSASVWHHVAVTVYAEDAAFFINGTVEGVVALEGMMVDSSENALLLGQSSLGIGSYSGLMAEMYLYTQALTRREVLELVHGSFPSTHLSPECHCPPSHPVVDINNEASCIQHTGTGLISRGSVLRINPLARPPGFINDFGTGADNGWVSAPGDRQANITLTLTNSLYELIFINFRFGSPRFRAAVLETSRDNGVTFEPMQYFADDCMAYFNLPDNGMITEADQVNCITDQSLQTPTFGVDVRFRLLNQQVRTFSLNESPELRHFILSSHLRLRLVDLFDEGTSTRHQYYNILEVTVAARCACNGHSRQCGNSIDSVCVCVHNTDGDTCDRCLPLYNDKPWQYGETSNAYPCKICDCSGHADSCHYNAAFDPFPNRYDLGGGGVCDKCQSNTAGQHCETCAVSFFRPSGVSSTDPAPCVPCGCDLSGVTDDGDCVKSEGIPGQLVGQCQCKSNVIGLQCDTCRDGFFALSATNPQGCSPCNCNTDGTVNSGVTCNAITGQCQCKENVIGLKCDQCINGTTSLNSISELGCSPCACDPEGSLSSSCNPFTGQCRCREGVGGVNCDQCLDGFFAFSSEGCQPCSCTAASSLSDICNKISGECSCLENVEGKSCDMCASGFYDLSAGCIACACDARGTVGGNDVCNATNGQCQCKSNVQGRTCNTCISGFTNLDTSNEFGCADCNCSDFGTNTSGSICDAVTSECYCLPSATGALCESCVPGFRSTSLGCVECGCHLDGSSSDVCDVGSGQCPCNDGVGGRTCNVCLDGFFQFPRCTECGCSSAGTASGDECNRDSGECNCKMHVTGDLCDSCRPGFQMFDASNPFGCSAAPDEQGRPTAVSRSSTSVDLSWLFPEAPNGVILGYIVYRNGTVVSNTTDMLFTDTGLTPDSLYTYSIQSFNVIGSTRSAEVVVRTLEGIPVGVDPPTYPVINSTAVVAMWTEPSLANGIITEYRLVLVAVRGGSVEEEEVFRGPALTSIVAGLQPFTNYSLRVEACTSGGCGTSTTSQVTTAEAPPTFQLAPNVTTLSSSELAVQWSAPAQPNGVILRYEVFQRDSPFEGEGMRAVTTESDVLSVVVSGLHPFTSYQFRVESHTQAGGTTSLWSEGTTAEDAPSEVPPPSITGLSSTSLRINWSEPTRPNGIVTEYTLFSVNGSVTTFLTNSSSPGSLVVDGLQPFTGYEFLVEVCTAAGCSESAVGTGFTQESVPTSQASPSLANVTALSVDLRWVGPAQPNGIITSYLLHRRLPSLLPSPALNDVGVAFRGRGYATFTPARPSSVENQLYLRFRTLDCCGVVFYSINTAHTDILAIEMRDGVPWFIFDSGTGPAAIRPDGDIQFNDGLWHTLRAVQDGQDGSITVDSSYTGSGRSFGTSTVVGYAVHHVGGVPSGLPLQTTNGHVNSSTTLTGESFAGCLFNVTFNEETFDFSSSSSDPTGVGSPAQGCPVDLTPTAQFLGGGYLALEAGTITETSFNISFRFRTTHTDGFLFFMYTSDRRSFGMELIASSLYVVLYGVNQFTIPTQDRLCNGDWHTITIEQDGEELKYTVDEISDALTLPSSSSSSSSSIFSSQLFFGGVPLGSVASQLAREAGLDTNTPFSGCIQMPQPLLHVSGAAVRGKVAAYELVQFDGCGSVPGSSCVDPWDEVYTGASTEAVDTNLTPFSTYLYRVEAVNSAGSGYSPWVSTSTLQSAPSGIGSVTLTASSSSSLTVSWNRPSAPNGLITDYTLTAMDPGSATVVTTSLGIAEPEQRLTATLGGLSPFTVYSVVLFASTSAGTGRGEAVNLTTMESAPAEVQSPQVTLLGSRVLILSWGPPARPNGVITQYNLFVDGQLRFAGTNTTATIAGLQASTLYTFFLQACTSAGCANSSSASNTTLPDRPAGLAPPTITPLTPTSLRITWTEPTEPNGEILQYELQLLSGEGLSDTTSLIQGLDLQFQLAGLTPNTLYSFRVLATNAGGTTASGVGENRTLEDAPDGLTPPVLTVLSATAISVSWAEPSQPNGVITEYILFRNGSEVFRGLERVFVDADLLPFTPYSYSLQACTSGNCSSTTQSSARTDEASPEGLISPSITAISATSLFVTLSDITTPNGIVRYVLSVTGEFESSLGDSVETRVVYNDTSTAAVEVSALLPFTSYLVQLTVSNGAGSLVDSPVTAMTSPAAPEGLATPTLTLDSATTLRVSWTSPERPNDEVINYRLRISNDRGTLIIVELGTNTSAVATDLQPFTNYTVDVVAYNSIGNTSTSARITTGETAPDGFDQVTVEQVDARFIVLSWDPPARPNGALTNYTVLQGGRAVVSLDPSTFRYNVTALSPFTTYVFSVEVCTAAGCVTADQIEVRTSEDVPEGVPRPSVTATGIQNQLLVAWQPPSLPNGVILLYYIERALQNSGDFTRLGTVSGRSFLFFADLTAQSFTEYDYRIVAENSAGAGAGPVTSVLSPEAAPMGVEPPTLSVLSSTGIRGIFQPPLTPNGNVTSYSLTRSTFPPSTPVTIPLTTNTLSVINGSFIYDDLTLSPFTNYTYTLTACTGGGCTVSEGVWTVTDEAPPTGLAAPQTNTTSHSNIALAWASPAERNGVILHYTLLRRSFGFDLPSEVATLPNCCQDYVQASGNGSNALSQGCSLAVQVNNTLTYEDTGLQAYTYYQYCVVATNSAGSTFSPVSLATQTDPSPVLLAAPELTASTINSTTIFLSWTALNVSQLLGPLEGYTLYETQVMGSEGAEAEVHSGLDLQFTHSGLTPSTEYSYVVRVSNGVGTAASNEAVTITDEGIPANLSAPELQAVSSTVISITWAQPNQPNGFIVSYTIFLNSVEYHNQTLPGTILATGLLPFTLYTVRVEACTQYGCVRSPLVQIMTLEDAPVGLASPTVTVLGPTSANISWTPPSQPNGNITSYYLYQREANKLSLLLQSSLSLTHSATNLRPFTMYGFEVFAINGAGNVSSGVTTITTNEAPPTSLDSPLVIVISSTEIHLSWKEPETLNGVLLGYQIYRNSSVLLNNAFSTDYTDINLEPFTRYSYVIEACTNGGCTSSVAVSNVTYEALPEGVAAPAITELQARSLSLLWQTPDQPNGIITDYILYLLHENGSATVLFQGLDLSFSLDGLTPFSSYSFFVEVCNSIGCSTSAEASTTTLQAAPEDLQAPQLRNLTSTSAHIEWLSPATPNGPITNYTLRKAENGSTEIIVFQGLTLSYDDTRLRANTLYAYTVEAINAEGSVVSAPSYIRTVADLADGIAPPSVLVQGPTSILITWTPPQFPNGEVSLYILYMDSVAVFSGLQFDYLSSDLTPFTEYTFYYEVVNQAGSAGSTQVTNRTDPAPPDGFLPPQLTILGVTAIEVRWQPPLAPNGDVEEYRIFRRLFGNPLTNLLHYFSRDTSVLSFTNSGLEPFTRYEYRLEVFNQAGSSLSAFSDATTAEDAPDGVSPPVIQDADIFSRNLTASWSPPSHPNGIITGYRLEYRFPLDTTMTAAQTTAVVTTATVTGLLPARTYEFRVVAINGAGEGVSEWVVVTTADDVPEGIAAIVVETRTEASLTLTWSIPATPNGAIREYILLLDGVEEYRDSFTTYIVTRLQPFTSYSLQLAACTMVGCTYGSVQFATTAEAAPIGLSPPTVTALTPRSVDLSWSEPSSPNGIILLYELLRQEDTSSPSVLFSSDNVASLVYQDVSVLPATSYGYAIAANNSAGRVVSEYRSVVTPEAAPEGITAARLIVTSSSTIDVSWKIPTHPNGFITEYRVFRAGGGLANVSVHTGQGRQFTDTDLTPFTAYTYTLQACTDGGCGFSPSATNTTFEAIPEDFNSVQALAISESSIAAEWEEPSSPNGIILRYMVSVTTGRDTITIVTTELSVMATNLEPFTNYTVNVDACNSIGCTQDTTFIVTLESIPQFIAPPTLTPISPTSITARWEEPARPNGIIVSYTLRRDRVTVFQGSSREFNDTNLSPNQVYSYTVQAFTGVGGGEESAPRNVITPPDTPQDIQPPVLTITGPNSIRADWQVPGQPNGEIMQYILSVNGTVVFQRLAPFQFLVEGLTPFTFYAFCLDVCTTTCGNSSVAITRTAEAPPTGQTPPTLTTPFQNTTVFVSWQPPAVPNGVITAYQLERRGLTESSAFTPIFTGPGLQFQDSDGELRPATDYEYRITSRNSAGNNTSPITTVTLPDGPPQGILPLEFSALTSSSLVLAATPPSIPNGQITRYLLHQDEQQVDEKIPVNQDSGVEFAVSSLQPFTMYKYRVEVCTVGGCGRGDEIEVMTAEDVPRQFDSKPVGVASSARSILVSWTPPSQPNGVIRSYSLWFRLSCPQPEQPQLPAVLACTEGPLTLATNTTSLQYTFTGSASRDPFPYSRYQFLVGAKNGMGAVNSTLSDTVETPTSAPDVTGVLQFETDQASSIITLDWSNTFSPNGPVQRYTLFRNEIPLFSRPVTMVTLSNEPKGIELKYKITLQTGNDLSITGTATIESPPLRLDAITTAQPTTNATSSSTNVFYREPAFIIGMVIPGVFLLFLCGAVVLCCITPRGDPGYTAKSPSVHLDHTPSKQSYEMKPMRPSTAFTGSWSPGQPIWEDLPDLGEEEGPLVTPRKKSYSPRREERMGLLEEEREEEEEGAVLPDTHISGYGKGSMSRQGRFYSPKGTEQREPRQQTTVYANGSVPRHGHYQTTSAEEDFSTFRASQTTFADTKV